MLYSSQSTELLSLMNCIWAGIECLFIVCLSDDNSYEGGLCKREQIFLFEYMLRIALNVWVYQFVRLIEIHCYAWGSYLCFVAWFIHFVLCADYYFIMASIIVSTFSYSNSLSRFEKTMKDSSQTIACTIKRSRAPELES